MFGIVWAVKSCANEIFKKMYMATNKQKKYFIVTNYILRVTDYHEGFYGIKY